MRTVLLLLFVGAATPFVEVSEWQAFKDKHNKTYANAIEELYRMKVYAENKAYVAQHMREHAAGRRSHTLALNRFADLTRDEWRRLSSGLRPAGDRRRHERRPSGRPAPASLDWRDHGAVTEVRDQGPCGSCWVFSVTGTLEGAWALAGNQLVSLSGQQLIDCSGSYGNYGCNGGYMDYGYKYIKENGGIQSKESYPYIARDDTCHADGAAAATLSSWVDLPVGDEAALLDATAGAGPVAVGFDATSIDFQLYSGGVLDDQHCSKDRAGHSALVVGYGTLDGADYWLVKNSWGTSWGVDGYVMMSRNKDNQCGIASMASYAVV